MHFILNCILFLCLRSAWFYIKIIFMLSKAIRYLSNLLGVLQRRTLYFFALIWSCFWSCFWVVTACSKLFCFSFQTSTWNMQTFSNILFKKSFPTFNVLFWLPNLLKWTWNLWGKLYCKVGQLWNIKK